MAELCITCRLPLIDTSSRVHYVEISGVRLGFCHVCTCRAVEKTKAVGIDVAREVLQQKAPDVFAKMQKAWQTAQRVAAAVKE